MAYYGHDDTFVRAINRGREVVWEYVVGTPVKTSPVVTGNLLFVYDLAGYLWCWLYLRYRTLAPLVLSHAILGTAVATFLGPPLLAAHRVGALFFLD